jgi:ABC-type maltose transport system permease subunit
MGSIPHSTNWSVFSAAALTGSIPVIAMFGILMVTGKKRLY